MNEVNQRPVKFVLRYSRFPVWIRQILALELKDDVAAARHALRERRAENSVRRSGGYRAGRCHSGKGFLKGGPESWLRVK